MDRVYALMYQPISVVDWNFSVISGIAVVSMDISSVIKKTAMLKLKRMVKSLGPVRM